MIFLQVYNSIDAKSTCIAVRVDFTNYRIEVIDNGEGICKLESIMTNDILYCGHEFVISAKDNLKRIGSRYVFKPNIKN